VPSVLNRDRPPPADDRGLPRDIPAEQGALGTAMFPNRDALLLVLNKLGEEDFYRPAHRAIYRAIRAVHGRGDQVDAISVMKELDEARELPDVGGAPYLHSLVQSVPMAAHAHQYVAAVVEEATWRRLSDAGAQISQLSVERARGSSRMTLTDAYAEARKALDRTRIDSSESFNSWGVRGDLAFPTLDRAAYRGLAGRVVDTLGPHTEADPAALLVTFVVMFGNVVGPGPHALVGAARHPARLNVILVADTALGRKGTAQTEIGRLYAQAEPRWHDEQVRGGLSSGEGLIRAVADDNEDVVDKRLLVLEQEFSRVLVVAAREKSTLSEIIRDCYDHGRLRVMTRQDPLKATGAHISMIGHITMEELRHRLTSLDAANGFGNRQLFACVRRSKLLPHGGNLDPAAVDHLVEHLQAAIRDAQAIKQVLTRTPDANHLWEEAYRAWAENSLSGLAGALTARADAHTLRLSVAYALLDGSARIEAEHVQAALAVWNYCQASVRYLFGDTLGNDVADRLLDALRDRYPEGLDSTGQYELYSRNVTAQQLRDARALLERRHPPLIRTEQLPAAGRGRLTIISYAVPPPTNPTN
jgi:DnaB-like helicase N terminal domain